MLSSLDKEFILYYNRLDEQQKKSLLEVIKAFFQQGAASINPISVEQYNRELDEAMERISKGRFTTLEELEKEMGSW